jgi:preprotein translocase subunit SecG
MFYGFLLVVHTLVAVLLIVVILIQRGRGGGLLETFSGVESMFGTKTNLFLTRTTAVLASLFLFTSVFLALLAARQSRSLIDERAVSSSQQQILEEEAREEGQPVESELPINQDSQEQAAQEENIPE